MRHFSHNRSCILGKLNQHHFCNKKISYLHFAPRDRFSKSKPDSRKKISRLYSNSWSNVKSLSAQKKILSRVIWLRVERPSGLRGFSCCDGRIVTSQKKFLVGNHFRDHIPILHRLITFLLKTFGKWRNGSESFLSLHQRPYKNPQSKIWTNPLKR